MKLLCQQHFFVEVFLIKYQIRCDDMTFFHLYQEFLFF